MSRREIPSAGGLVDSLVGRVDERVFREVVSVCRRAGRVWMVAMMGGGDVLEFLSIIAWS